jgi:hypothetical protein
VMVRIGKSEFVIFMTGLFACSETQKLDAANQN